MAEKEYIERGALAEEIASLSVTVTGIRCGKSYLNEIVKHYKNSIDRIINEQPTADVVEVVRCKDCVSSRPLRRNDRFEALFAEGCVYCMRNDEGVGNENFCSFGERKDDNHEASDGN